MVLQWNEGIFHLLTRLQPDHRWCKLVRGKQAVFDQSKTFQQSSCLVIRTLVHSLYLVQKVTKHASARKKIQFLWNFGRHSFLSHFFACSQKQTHLEEKNAPVPRYSSPADEMLNNFEQSHLKWYFSPRRSHSLKKFFNFTWFRNYTQWRVRPAPPHPSLTVQNFVTMQIRGKFRG